jgi:predicted  nucleic acid-binding Zn-ribbon protein
MATHKCTRCGIIRNDFQKVLLALTPEKCKPTFSTATHSSHEWRKISDKNEF